MLITTMNVLQFIAYCKIAFRWKIQRGFLQKNKNQVKPRSFYRGCLTRTAKTADGKTKLEIRPYLSDEAEWWSALRPAHNRQSKERAQRTTELSERNRDEVTSESDRHMLREQGTPEVQGPAEVTQDPGSVVKLSAS